MTKTRKLQRVTRKEKPTADYGDIVDLNKMPLNSIEDYEEYNDQARRLGRPVKIPPEELHPKWKVKFQRFDQPENVLKYRYCTAEIDTQGQLIPGKTYTLPRPVVLWLNSLATPIYEQVPVNDGGSTKSETRQTGERARFSCQFLEEVA